MKSPGILGRLDDRINPIVIKELRQAVHSKFVVAVLLLFLLAQLVYFGLFLAFTSALGNLQSPDYEAGREVFFVLQIILLTTCLVFVPAYTGIRLGAERSDVNVDLLFISTLPPRAIVWGKLVAGLVLAVMIFSACAPFMTFTYLLRGIDLPVILLVVAGDFLLVMVTVQVAIFLAAVPANRVGRAALGLVGLITVLMVLYTALFLTATLMFFGAGDFTLYWGFWATAGGVGAVGLAVTALFYSWSVAVISPPASNRGLVVRLTLLLVWLVSGAACGALAVALDDVVWLTVWVIFVGSVCVLTLVIAVHERERWSPRVARTIPRRRWLRGPAFLLYSGAAGGVLFVLVLAGLTWLALHGWLLVLSHRGGGTAAIGPRLETLGSTFNVMAMLTLYTYCYVLSAVLVRRLAAGRVKTPYTGVVLAALMMFGMTVPNLLAFLLFYREWSDDRLFFWLLLNPVKAAIEAGYAASPYRDGFFGFAGIWAVLITALNLPWFFRQMVRFRPHVGGPASAAGIPVLGGSQGQMDVTKTAGGMTPNA